MRRPKKLKRHGSDPALVGQLARHVLLQREKLSTSFPLSRTRPRPCKPDQRRRRRCEPVWDWIKQNCAMAIIVRCIDNTLAADVLVVGEIYEVMPHQRARRLLRAVRARSERGHRWSSVGLASEVGGDRRVSGSQSPIKGQKERPLMHGRRPQGRIPDSIGHPRGVVCSCSLGELF